MANRNGDSMRVTLSQFSTPTAVPQTAQPVEKGRRGLVRLGNRLGPPKVRALDQPVTISPESLVPADHFYRHLDASLDLTFVRAWVEELYKAGGRPSLDPVVFFKLQLILFCEGLRSERRLMETASLHLAHRWYLGYGRDEPLPDHSSLTRIRQRLGLPIFQRCFEHVVERCQEAGLVWGRDLFFDATKVQANAVATILPSPAHTDRRATFSTGWDVSETGSEQRPYGVPARSRIRESALGPEPELSPRPSPEMDP
jgi:transposase